VKGTFSSTLGRWLKAGGPFFGLIFVCLLFARTEAAPFIFAPGNLKNVLVQTVIVSLGALGMTLIIVSGGIDLSVGSVVAFTSVLGAKLLTDGWSTVPMALAVIVTGGLIGLLNGSLIAGLRLLPFIVTLGMMGMIRGSAKWLANSQTISIAGDSPVVTLMARLKPREFMPLPPGVWLALGLAALVAFVLRQSVFGRRIFALGSSEAPARLCGVRIGLTKVLIYGLAGLFFGLAGLFQLARLTQGDPSIAVGLELDIIAAVVIGGASLNGGTGSILGSLIGALVMAVLRNGASLCGWPNYAQEIAIGAAIVVAVALDQWRQGRRN
jgi:ribose transport system permease protein